MSATDNDIPEFYPPEFPKVTFIDAYFRGYHVGITGRGKGIIPAQDFIEQAKEIKIAIGAVDEMGFTPSWNQATNESLRPKTVATAPHTTPQTAPEAFVASLGIDGPKGQGGVCPIHQTPLVWKSGTDKVGKLYAFWACPERLADGSWCKGR